MAKEPKKPQPSQTVVYLNGNQRLVLDKLADLEDKNISDTIKEALKALAAKHGLEWPKNRA